MNEYKGISMFKVSKEQHRRLLVSLWIVIVLTVIRNIVLPSLPGNAENAGLLLLLPVVKGKVFMSILGAAVVVAQCVILNELRVALRRIAHWGQWACLVFMVALVSNFMLGSVFTWFGTDASFYFSTVSRVVSYLQIGSFFLLSGAWLVVACVLAFSFSGRIKDCGLVLLALLMIVNAGIPVLTKSLGEWSFAVAGILGFISFIVSLLFYYYIYKCFETTKNPQE